MFFDRIEEKRYEMTTRTKVINRDLCSVIMNLKHLYMNISM